METLIFEKIVNGKPIHEQHKVTEDTRDTTLTIMDKAGWRLISENGKPVVMELRAIREMLKMSRRELSEACFNIPVRSIEDWESGRRKPPEYIVPLIICRLEQLGLL